MIKWNVQKLKTKDIKMRNRISCIVSISTLAYLFQSVPTECTPNGVHIPKRNSQTPGAVPLGTFFEAQSVQKWFYSWKKVVGGILHVFSSWAFILETLRAQVILANTGCNLPHWLWQRKEKLYLWRSMVKKLKKFWATAAQTSLLKQTWSSISFSSFI